MVNVLLPKETYVDLYDATGIAVGTQINVVNLTTHTVTLYSTVGQPTPADDHLNLVFGKGNVQNAAGATGAWAIAIETGAVDVTEA